jgi:hypothetical protein
VSGGAWADGAEANGSEHVVVGGAVSGGVLLVRLYLETAGLPGDLVTW